MQNKLLQRQIRKHFGKPEDIPSEFTGLLKVISESYDHYEKDRKMLERSIDLSSNEMTALNDKLRFETNEAMRANNELNRIFNAIDEIIFSVDIPNNRLTHVSAACEKIYGYTAEEFYRTHDLWQKVIHPEDFHISIEFMDELQKGNIVFNQYRIIHKNKRVYWIENKITPTLDKEGKLIRVDGVTSDITKRKLAEISLSENEEQIQAIFNAVLDSIIVIDDKEKIIKWDSKAETLFGWKEFEVIGSQLSEAIIPPGYSEEHYDSLMHFIKTGNVSAQGKTIEVRAVNKNKAEFDISLSISVSLVKNKHQFICFIRDISERKQAERETLKLVDTLQSKNKDLSQFAYIVSHNLRAPIAKIQGLATLLDNQDEKDDFNKMLLEHILTEAKNLDEVVKDMNSIITARDSKSKPKEQIVLDTELKLITHVLENEIRESGAILTINLDELKEMFTIKSYIYSIMYNLISNAVKYRSQDIPLKIHIQSGQDDKFNWFLVKDNGTGIDLEKNGEKIFGLYRRFNDGNIPGKGIGLNLVKTQTEALGGRVEVESKVNQGSIFKIILPKLKKYGNNK